jgi:hypothetical protein
MAAPRAKRAKVGDTVELSKGPGYVQLPDGAVVSANVRYTFTGPGKHIVKGEPYTVNDPNAKADEADDE